MKNAKEKKRKKKMMPAPNRIVNEKKINRVT